MIIAIIILCILIFLFILFYNQIVREENAVKNAFSTIDVYLKKRYDLVPNLVEAVKGYAAHEEKVFEIVTNARSKALNSKNSEVIVKSDNELTAGLKSLFAVAEQYPALRSNELFMSLQKALLSLEDEISAARRTYNAAVTEYNITLESVPTNIIANMLKKAPKTLFDTSDDIRKAIKLDFKKDNN